MNWNKIKEKYPKAHKKLFDTCKVVIDIDSDRDLYDFFDEQGIIINVYNLFGSFWWDIKEYYERLFAEHAKEDQYKTRTEAEEKAFTKAFELLEEKL